MSPRLRTALAIPIVALALAATACGGSGGGEDASATTTVQATSAAASTSTGPTLASAKAEFSALVTPLNAEIGHMNTQIAEARKTNDVAAYNVVFKELRTQTATFTTGLLAISFPASVQPQVDDAVAATVKHQLALDELIRKADTGTLPTATVQTWTNALFELSARTTVLRNALGLPPVN